METISVELDFPEGIVSLEFKKVDGPQLVTDIICEILPLCDGVTTLGTEIASQFGKTISCKKGCGVCCCQLVPVSPFEASVIANIVDSLPEQEQKTVISNFKQAQEKLEHAGLSDKILSIYSSTVETARVNAINRSYFELKIACPFLVEGSCSIYKYRPSRCREFSVISPAEYCADPFTNPVKKLPVTIALSESFSFAWSSLTGKPPIIIPLISALSWVNEHGDTRAMSIEGSERFIRAVLGYATKKAHQSVGQQNGSINKT